MDFHVCKLTAQAARKTLRRLREIAQRHAITNIFIHHFTEGGAVGRRGVGGGRGVKDRDARHPRDLK